MLARKGGSGSTRRGVATLGGTREAYADGLRYSGSTVRPCGSGLTAFGRTGEKLEAGDEGRTMGAGRTALGAAAA